MDFGTADERLCGICGCKNENGMWEEDGYWSEDVICDECDKVWRYDCDLDAYLVKKCAQTGE